MIYKLKDKTLILATFFSLGLHGLLACFLIPSAQKGAFENINAIEVVWEKGDTLLKTPSRKRGKPEKPSTPKKKKIHKALSQIKKGGDNRPILVDSFVHGGSEGKKNSSPKPMPKMVVNRKAHHPLPAYPWICRKRRQEGMVCLDVRTNSDGCVLEVNLYKSSGYSRLDEVAIEAVKTWIFAEGSQKKVLTLAFRLKK